MHVAGGTRPGMVEAPHQSLGHNMQRSGASGHGDTTLGAESPVRRCGAPWTNFRHMAETRKMTVFDNRQ